MSGAGVGAVVPAGLRPEAPVAKKDARAAIREFEAYFTGELLKHAAQSSDEKSLLGGGQAGQMYREFLYQELARIVSKGEGLGLVSALSDRLEAQPSPTQNRGEESGS